MRFASLGSGSEGNGLLVEVDGTCILVDCGFNVKEVLLRLARLGVEAEDLDGILITHEHDDHISGAARLARRYELPVWLTYGTLQASGAHIAGLETVRVFDCHQAFAIGAIAIEPYPVPHDAREPAQFVFGDGARRLGLLTDAGEVTAHMRAVLSGLDALLLECNHDPDLLRDSRYPPSLKRRIAGRLGHLDNEAAAQLLRDVDCSRLQHVIAAHLSQRNNTPALARAALAAALDCAPEWIGIADQAQGLCWRQVA